MWRTQIGARLLQGAEARLMKTALGVLADQIEAEIAGHRDDFDFGVPVFDRLDCRQRLALVADIGHHLLRSTDSPPQLTASNESALAVVYKVVEDRVSMEVDDEELIQELGCCEDPFHWRRMLLDAYRDRFPDDLETPAETSPDIGEWFLLIDCLANCVIRDADAERVGTGIKIAEQTGDASAHH
jgi:hypothetical protein